MRIIGGPLVEAIRSRGDHCDLADIPCSFCHAPRLTYVLQYPNGDHAVACRACGKVSVVYAPVMEKVR